MNIMNVKMIHQSLHAVESVTTARPVAHERVMFPFSVLLHNSHSLLELNARARSEGSI